MKVSITVATSLNEVIGRGDDLPWSISADLRRFRELTSGHVCIVGARTQATILKRLGHPLPKRLSIVVSHREVSSHSSVIAVSDPLTALHSALSIEQFAGGDEIFIIGGAQIYHQLLPHADRVYLTRVLANVRGDAIMPTGWLNAFVLVSGEEIINDIGASDPYCFEYYERRRNG